MSGLPMNAPSPTASVTEYVGGCDAQVLELWATCKITVIDKLAAYNYMRSYARMLTPDNHS